ncbi:aminoglycoside phosphotransferase family protein [Methylobacterium sp. A54F]
MEEVTSHSNGVLGVFGVPGRRFLAGCPGSGEFVAWLAENDAPLDPFWIEDALEVGTVAALAAQERGVPPARYFNAVRVGEDTVEKRARDARFAPLIEAETRWYGAVAALGFPHVPAVIAEEPLTLARVRGCHPFDLDRGPLGQERVLATIVTALRRLHSSGTRPGTPALADQMYREKPLARLEAVRRLVPAITAHDRLRINGVSCRNILHPTHAAWFHACVDALIHGSFTPIHGDPTFSNTLIDADGKPWFIDPRGQFGVPSLYGDPRYDWAKLYYSVAGSYDRFNARRFVLRLHDDSLEVAIEPHGWEHLRDNLEDGFGRDREAIRVIHALIWLSLSGFVLDDYDSIIAAYALGLYHFEAATA